MQVVLGLGSNLGNREENLARALDALERLEGTQLLKLSNLYETEPFDVISQQENYLNCCVLLETSQKPQRLLEHCLEIEKSLGRVRLEYHGSRTIDIDVLLCQGFSSDSPQLTVPHPHIRERAFVLVPLSDLFPAHQAFGYDFHQAYEAVDKSSVALYK
mgnify:FL=1